MNIAAHLVAERRVDHLMALQGANASERTADHDCLEVRIVFADDRCLAIAEMFFDL